MIHNELIYKLWDSSIWKSCFCFRNVREKTNDKD